MINERLKEVRKSKEVNLSQREFGRRLGVQDTAISKLESGERNLTDQMILAICREFKVNEDWLRTGKCSGESMFEECDDTNIAAVVSEFDLDTLSQTILKAYVAMDCSKRKIFNSFVQEIANQVLEQGKEKARIGISGIIMDSNATNAVKMDLVCKASAILQEAFPYVGTGNIDESEIQETFSAGSSSVNGVKDTYHAASSTSGKEHGIVSESVDEIERLKSIPRVMEKDNF